MFSDLFSFGSKEQNSYCRKCFFTCCEESKSSLVLRTPAPFMPSEGAVADASRIVCGCESLPGMAEG